MEILRTSWLDASGNTITAVSYGFFGNAFSVAVASHVELIAVVAVPYPPV